MVPLQILLHRMGVVGPQMPPRMWMAPKILTPQPQIHRLMAPPLLLRAPPQMGHRIPPLHRNLGIPQQQVIKPSKRLILTQELLQMDQPRIRHKVIPKGTPPHRMEALSQILSLKDLHRNPQRMGLPPVQIPPIQMMDPPQIRMGPRIAPLQRMDPLPRPLLKNRSHTTPQILQICLWTSPRKTRSSTYRWRASWKTIATTQGSHTIN